MIVGICGLGFVGKAIWSFMQNKDMIAEVVVYDKYKKCNDKQGSQGKQDKQGSQGKQGSQDNDNILEALLPAKMIYICLPTPYVESRQTYNTDELDNTLYLLNELKYTGIILIKSTVLPLYCETMNNTFPALTIIHNPEFLSANTAVQDFSEQTHIILGYTKYSQPSTAIVESFYKTLFPQALISITTASTSAMTKLACNSYYATKVQFFTEIFLLCNKIQVEFHDVKDLMLNNHWINPMHTNVPGRDGRISFGGACLPKDIKALSQFMQTQNSCNGVLEAVIQERNTMRPSE